MADQIPIAVLVDRMESMSEQLRQHRVEASEASERQGEKLDDLILRVRTLEDRGRAVDLLVRTIHGEGSEIGLKIRQDRTERTLGVIVWAVTAIGVVVIGKFVEWVIHLGGKSA